ncbi:extracellular solute-binding protein, partial [Paenibacillus sepulcri]|nr:extracellular solute-binding protein [Paenibacillus sepulcri]
KTTVTASGKVFGVPVGTTVVGAVLYNKKVYADLGLEIPRTWDEFMANNEKIKAAGKTAVIGTYKDTWTSQLLILGDYYNVQSQNASFADDYTANKAKYATTPAALRGFEKIEDVYKRGYMNKDFLATTYDAGLKMLAEGDGVHYPMLTSALDSIFQNFPDKINDIGVFPEPSDSADINGLTVWMPSALYLNKDSKNLEAAKKWTEYFLSPEGQSVLSSKLKASGPYLITGIDLPEDTYAGVKEMQSYFDEGKTAPALEFLSPVKGPNLENITVAVGSGINTAAQGAKDYDKDVEKQAQQLALPGW